MVDVHHQDTSVDKSIGPLLSWLGTFKGFHNKLILNTADNAGRGLFVYAKSLQPGEPILVIPAPALLNPLTLRASPLNTIPAHLYPTAASTSSPPRHSPRGTPRLTSTQLLTLHLALTRDPQARHKSEWQVFIDSLPEFRPWHPLTWVVPNADLPEAQQDKFWPALEASMSESVRIKIAAVKKRWEEDLWALRRVLRDEEPFRSQNMVDAISTETFLWAWLNVNTRTVAMPLGLSEPSGAQWPVNNHSFIPLLDMINHSSIPHVFCPKPEPMPSTTVRRTARGFSRPTNAHLVPGKVDLVLFAPLRGLEEGEEVTFLYGPHSNAMLFAEYGFTELSEEECTLDVLHWPNADVDVTPWVERLWEQDGSDDKRRALEAAGLWGHNRLAANLGEPAPSTGLMSTLCLMSSPTYDGLGTGITPESLRTGPRAFSRPTKTAARRALARICESVLADLEECQEDTDAVAATAGSDPEKLYAVGVVRALFREEQTITRSVLDLVESGAAIPGF